MLLVAGVHGLRLSESTGRGIRLDENCYLTNQCSAELGKLLSRPFQLAIGSLEYSALLSAHAAVYWKDVPNEKDPAEGLRILTRWLQIVDAFFMALWAVRDNAVNCEFGFLEHNVPGQGVTHASNFIASLFYTARGTRDPMTFTLEEVRLAREYFRDFFVSAY